MHKSKIDIKEIVSQSKHLSDLEKLLADKGIKFKSKRKLSKFLHNEWLNAHKEELEKIDKEPLDKLGPDDVPFTELKKEGVVYKLHGLAHGQPPFAKLSADTKNRVCSYFKKHRNSKEDVLFENNFSYAFEVDVPEMGESASWNRLTRSEKLKYVLFSYGIIPLMPLAIHIIKTSEDYRYKFMQYVTKSMQDFRYIKKARKAYSLFELPEPLSLELKLQNNISDKYSAFRSEEMALSLISFAKGTGIETMHACVGLGHEHEIAYYINKYSVKKIKRQGKDTYKLTITDDENEGRIAKITASPESN
jgi:hypothetical protein